MFNSGTFQKKSLKSANTSETIICNRYKSFHRNFSKFIKHNVRFVGLAMKYIHKVIFRMVLFAALCNTNMSSAQELKLDYQKLKNLTLLQGTHYIYGYNYQGQHGLEFGLAKGRRNLLKPFNYQNVHATGMVIFPQNESKAQGPLFAVNAGITYAKLFTVFSIQGQYMTNFQNNGAFVLRPEAGLTFLGLFDVTYGYNFFAPKDRYTISNHVLSVRITRQRVYRDIKQRLKSLKMKDVPLKIEIPQADSTSTGISL